MGGRKSPLGPVLAGRGKILVLGGFFGPKMPFCRFWFTFLAVLIHFFGKMFLQVASARSKLSNAPKIISFGLKFTDLRSFEPKGVLAQTYA